MEMEKRLGIRILPSAAAVSVGFVVCIVGMLLCAHPARAQPGAGFISIDCGAVDGFTDITTGIPYDADLYYISTGSTAKNLTADLTQLTTLRYFPAASTPKKNCYELPVEPNNQYLVRAFFYYNGYDAAPANIDFGLSLDSTVWTDVSIPVNLTTTYFWEEAIYYTQKTSLSVCLIRTDDASTPFISALELRLLPTNIYIAGRTNSPAVAASFFLHSLRRRDFGNSGDNLRYPDDSYDRIWQSYPTQYGSVSAPAGQEFVYNTSDIPDLPPNKVMQTAMTDPTTVSYSIGPFESIVDRLLYISFFIAEVVPAGTSRIMNITGNFFDGPIFLDTAAGPPYFIYNIRNFAFQLPDTGYVSVVVTKNSSSNSTLGPLLNGFELYSIRSVSNDTDATEVTALRTIKRSLGVNVWAGDPCFPLPWSGLKCTGHQVTSIDLSNQGLSGLFPDFSALTTLTSLDLSDNKFNTIIPVQLLQQLQGPHGSTNYLNLSSNLLTGTIPDALIISSRGSLTVDMSNNQLDGSIPLSFGMANVTILRLQNNRLSGDMELYLEKSSNLTELQLQGNRLTGRIGAATCANWATTMEVLDLSSNSVDLAPNNSLSIMLDTFANLRELRLSNIRNSGRLPATRTMSRYKLEVLDLSYSNLVGDLSLLAYSTFPSGSQPLLDNSSPFPSLQSVNLSSNMLEGPVPTSLLLMPSLLALDLSNNKLSGNFNILFPIANQLQSPDLSNNELRGAVPLSLLLMPTLRALNLSSNPLSAQLPSLLAPDGPLNATALTALDLSHSNLEGDLHKSFMAQAQFLFPNLKSLDLSGNRLTGQVPPSLACMQNLVALNLSGNGLSGPLPLLPKRLSNAAFFAGNPKLCGEPLRACPGSLYRLVLKLVAALIACGFIFSAGSCLFLAWRVRIYSKLHQQDADLIAALQGQDGAHLMSLAHLRKATSNFSHLIGVGGFGYVYKGKLRDGTLVAIKKSKSQANQQHDKDQFLNEVKILSQVHHRNLVRLLGCCLTNKNALLVFEFVSNGSLDDHLQGNKVEEGVPRLTWTQRLRIALHTADALTYLHSAANPPIIHRDVKSANILLDENMNAKVADFGISKLAPLDATHITTKVVQGTRGYIDPEYHQSFQLSGKSDVYSFGVVLLELISGRAPLMQESAVEEVIILAKVAVPLIKSENMQDLMDPAILETYLESANGKESIVGVGKLAVKCLEPSSRDRPTMMQVSKELSTLWLQLDTTLDPGSQQLSSMEVIPEQDCISFLTDTSSSFPRAYSSTGSSGSRIQLADMGSF